MYVTGLTKQIHVSTKIAVHNLECKNEFQLCTEANMHILSIIYIYICTVHADAYSGGG